MHEPATLSEIATYTLSEPCRFAFPSPLHGGPPIREIRATFSLKGRIRISGTRAKTFVDLDPGTPQKPLIALDIIARSDAVGLERMILSALWQVDEIHITVDGRSDEATVRVAEAFADEVGRFDAADIGVTEEDWKADKINFAAARNLGRARVKAPWALVLDTDEYLYESVDLREAVVRAVEMGAKAIDMGIALGEFNARDPQRLALSAFRWERPSHNQLMFEGPPLRIDATIVHDTSLRKAEDLARRDQQRLNGVNIDLAEHAKNGDLNSLFHLAKQRIGDGDDECLGLVADYRLRTEIHGPLVEERSWLALGAASHLANQEKWDDAETWCLRAMFDGPRVDAMCYLGDIAEERGFLPLALAWYEAACAVPDKCALKWQSLSATRFRRRDGLRKALEASASGNPGNVSV